MVKSLKDTNYQTQEATETLTSHIAIKGTEFIIKVFPQGKLQAKMTSLYKPLLGALYQRACKALGK